MQRARIQTAYKRRNQRKGKKLFENIPHHSYNEDSQKSCTTAREFIQTYSHKPPCVITIIQNKRQNAKFFYSRVGLFDYKYALINYRQFAKEINNFR